MSEVQIDPQFVLLIFKVSLIIVTSIILTQIFHRVVVKTAEEKLKIRRGHLVYVNRFFQLLIYSGAAIVILWAFDIDVTGLVAGLGVGALVVGFALKDIIENWVSGLLLIGGRTYEIGDVITTGGLTGTVTDISLRTTKLKTYDRNEIIIPNSLLLNDKIINRTGGEREAVASLVLAIDYSCEVEKAKTVIENVLRSHPHVIVDAQREREIRFVVRVREWSVEIESLFWINQPENEVFISSTILELIRNRFKEAGILPPIPSILRRDFLTRDLQVPTEPDDHLVDTG